MASPLTLRTRSWRALGFGNPRDPLHEGWAGVGCNQVVFTVPAPDSWDPGSWPLRRRLCRSLPVCSARSWHFLPVFQMLQYHRPLPSRTQASHCNGHSCSFCFFLSLWLTLISDFELNFPRGNCILLGGRLLLSSREIVFLPFQGASGGGRFIRISVC